MAKPLAAFFTEDDAPELRFEESNNGSANTRRAANHGATAAAPVFAVEDEQFSALNDKKANMLHYQQELERTQREVREMEQRRAKRDLFNNSRGEICERLARDISKLDGDLYNAQTAVEQIGAARESYVHHLEFLRSLQIEGNGHADDEMDRAIGAVEDATNEYRKTCRRLATVLPQLGAEAFAQGSSVPQNFKSWLRVGAAISIPLALAALVVAVVIKLIP